MDFSSASSMTNFLDNARGSSPRSTTTASCTIPSSAQGLLQLLLAVPARVGADGDRIQSQLIKVDVIFM